MSKTLLSFCTVIGFMVAIGCSQSNDSHSTSGTQEPAETEAHVHAEGPHGGILIELDAVHHAELVTDHDSHTVTIYVLKEESNEVTDAEVTALTLSVFAEGAFVDHEFTAADDPATFSLDDAQLCHMFDESEDVKARLKATIAGEEIIGKYEHEAHGEDDGHEH